MKPMYVILLGAFMFLGFTGINSDKTVVAQAGYFLKIEGIDGEATDKDHKDWINLLSFNQTITKPKSTLAGVARRRGDVILEDIVCTKEVDKSTPKLQEMLAKGKYVPKVILEVVSTTKPYLRYELSNVSITSYMINGGGDIPMEEFSLNFEEVKVTYSQYYSDGRKKGDTEFNWKVERGGR